MKTVVNKKGFTIIEVVLVLAIAGLIFLMVFLALPALQRSQRDTQRKGDMSRAIAAINDYKASHRGNLPGTTSSQWNTFAQQYLVGRPQGATGGASDRDSFIDPSGASNRQGNATTTYVFEERQGNNPVQAWGDETQNVMYFSIGCKCSEDPNVPTCNQGNRSVALRMPMENAGVYCLHQ